MLTVGDRVAVRDAGLASLRVIMPHMPPNNEGIVVEVTPDDALVLFDSGSCAPYPLADVGKLADATPETIAAAREVYGGDPAPQEEDRDAD